MGITEGCVIAAAEAFDEGALEAEAFDDGALEAGAFVEAGDVWATATPPADTRAGIPRNKTAASTATVQTNNPSFLIGAQC
ncbi:MAG: hypothetical protein LC750_10915 [Actinobacteria bacterium]|nr:hypothetical protein [Actinomycetota bacterium]